MPAWRLLLISWLVVDLEAGAAIAQSPPAEPHAPPLQAESRAVFETHVAAEAHAPGPHISVSGEALRTTPGTLGDPFRVIGLMPGVATPVPVLPLYVVRGASPGMSGFFLDGMRLPQLFHMFVGGGVIHAGLVERIDFLPGAYDVTLGRFAGGVIRAETRPARGDGQHLEAELRLYDVSTLIELKLPQDVRISLSGHYGYPSLLLRAIRPGVMVDYWDYQFRLDWRGLTVQALGSYDSLGITDSGISSSSVMSFHRVQVRLQRRDGPLYTEAALIGGLDRMQDFFQHRLEKLFLGYRLNVRLDWSRLHLYLGLDGELSRFRPQSGGASIGMGGAGALGAIPGASDGGSGSMAVDYGELTAQRNGRTTGVAVQAVGLLWPRRATLTAGTRVDIYEADGRALIGIDPRARLELHILPWLDLHLGGGLYQQPPSFPVQMPGIDTFALQLGLQRAAQLAIGQQVRLPARVTVQATGFLNRYYNASDFPPILAQQCAAPKPPMLSGVAADVMRVSDGQALGMELMVRKQEGRFSGWIAYTLSRSERFYPCGIRPADYDQTHILNIVAQVHLPRRVMASARLYVASGRPDTVPDVTKPGWEQNTLRNNYRLPSYVQLDLRVDREWLFRRWALSLFVELLNVTYSQTVLAVTQPPSETTTAWQPQLIGFNWILPSIGVRGRF